ncbi:MAG: SprT family zinc-dependent metalloprotease [Gammaproteobacteria bacterium]|nr:M48 family metallopeptidase [Pseudomonadota bacterium]MCZ6537139.1 SprT family zinc-dependent metalloprotease [Gammaproteobacteria bacterium]MCZ6879878.1 SprT family zinc-dependent metalloprotease [Gammaproteobacteria bacterium]
MKTPAILPFDTRRLALPEPAEKVANFRIRRSSRARYLSIQVHPPGLVEIVVPRRMPVREVESFVSAHEAWIRETCAGMSRRHHDPGTGPPARIRLGVLDREWSVSYNADARARRRVAESDTGLEVFGANDDAARRRALFNWLRRKARAFMVPAVGALALETGLRPRAIQIRAQRSRWGSCSSNKTLSLNLCLLFLEPELVRYLLIHELCHLRQMNHSPRFWALVEQFSPDGRILDQRLNDGWTRIPGWLLAEL